MQIQIYGSSRSLQSVWFARLASRRRSSKGNVHVIGIGSTPAPRVDGMSLRNGTDAGGWREFLAGRPVHAGDTLYLLTSLGWHPVRYETNVPRKSSFLYFSLPGVREDLAIMAPRDARFAWPDEL